MYSYEKEVHFNIRSSFHEKELHKSLAKRQILRNEFFKTKSKLGRRKFTTRQIYCKKL